MEIKVLALYHEENGSDFHRIVYPFKKVNGLELEGKTINVDLKKFEDVSLKEIEKYNILVYNWDLNLKIQDLGMLQAKGVKILYVLDDSYEIEESHPELGSPFMREYLKNRVKLHLLNANACIVTNERILLEAIKYNDNVAVIPNFIDPADFKVLEKSKIDSDFIDLYRKELKKKLHMDLFVKNIKSKIFPLYND
jgi:glycosyltransferase involved in cell wall biosynthesis